MPDIFWIGMLRWARDLVHIRDRRIAELSAEIQRDPDPLLDDLASEGPRREVELHRRDEARMRGEGRLYE